MNKLIYLAPVLLLSGCYSYSDNYVRESYGGGYYTNYPGETIIIQERYQPYYVQPGGVIYYNGGYPYHPRYQHPPRHPDLKHKHRPPTRHLKDNPRPIQERKFSNKPTN